VYGHSARRNPLSALSHVAGHYRRSNRTDYYRRWNSPMDVVKGNMKHYWWGTSLPAGVCPTLGGHLPSDRNGKVVGGQELKTSTI
jgi:hypothetical protein